MNGTALLQTVCAIAVVAVLAVVLVILFARRTLRMPVSVLLEAARRWSDGDLGARALMPRGVPPEFETLASACNDMAALQEQQRRELHALNDALELRVAERTAALLASNNRLQVEVADRELTEASLRQAQKLQAVGQLADGMAHEFNNLLTTILGSLELLRRPATAPERQAALIGMATDGVERGSRLTAQLLAFSRKQPMLAVAVDIPEALRSIGGLLSSTLGPAIRMETRVNDGLWPVLLDPNQFEAAILNLALNARDAMPEGGRLTISATNAAVSQPSAWTGLEPGDYVTVAVADTGCGMAPDVATRAFEPFFTTKPPGQGAGLGLSQVHGMVRQAGGGVRIESRPGQGTKLIMMLPRGPAAERPAAPMIEDGRPALAAGRSVLLVDDDAPVRDVTAAILAERGYSVVTAASGEEALAILQIDAGCIGLVITDYAMPGMNGAALMAAIRQHWPRIPALLATGYAEFPELIGRDFPADQVIRKPFRSAELLARARLLVQRHADGRAGCRAEPQD